MGKFSSIIILIISLQNTVFAKDITYITYVPWESDSVLVAWLINRYVDRDIKFESLAKGEKIKLPLTINTPNSKLKRNARYSAFETTVKYLKIKEDKCIKKLTKVIKILEMVPWQKHNYGDAMTFEQKIIPLLPSAPQKDGLDRAFKFIDKFCVKGQI